MQPVLGHLGLEGRDLRHLMLPGLRVFTLEVMAALAAGRRLQRDGLLDLLGWHQRALLTLVSRLPASLATRRGLRRWAFDVRRVARRRAGGIGRVLVQSLVEIIDLLLEVLQPLLILLNKNQDRRLGGGWTWSQSSAGSAAEPPCC